MSDQHRGHLHLLMASNECELCAFALHQMGRLANEFGFSPGQVGQIFGLNTPQLATLKQALPAEAASNAGKILTGELARAYHGTMAALATLDKNDLYHRAENIFELLVFTDDEGGLPFFNMPRMYPPFNGDSVREFIFRQEDEIDTNISILLTHFLYFNDGEVDFDMNNPVDFDFSPDLGC